MYPQNVRTVARLYLLVISVFLSAIQVSAAVSLDSPASSNGLFNAVGVSSITWSHTVGGNPSRALFVSISTSSTTLPAFPGPRVMAVTYGGNALSPVGTQLSSDNRNSVEIYRLVNPPIGSATVQVDLVAGVANYVVGGSTSCSGVDTADPNGAFTAASGNSNSPTIIVPDGVVGDLVLDTLATSPTGAFYGQGADQALVWNGRSYFGFAFDVGAGSTEPASSPVTMSWTTSGTDNWALAGFAVKSLGTTAAFSTISGRVMTSSGVPISYAQVKLQNLETGAEFYQTTNQFGHYGFENLETGRTYQIRVAQGRFSFEPDTRIFNLHESLTNFDFIASDFGKSLWFSKFGLKMTDSRSKGN